MSDEKPVENPALAPANLKLAMKAFKTLSLFKSDWLGSNANSSPKAPAFIIKQPLRQKKPKRVQLRTLKLKQGVLQTLPL